MRDDLTIITKVDLGPFRGALLVFTHQLAAQLKPGANNRSLAGQVLALHVWHSLAAFSPHRSRLDLHTTNIPTQTWQSLG